MAYHHRTYTLFSVIDSNSNSSMIVMIVIVVIVIICIDRSVLFLLIN